MYSPVLSLWLHVEFWLCLGIQTLTPSPSLSLCCPQAAASRPGIKRNSSPPPPPEPMVWLTPVSPLSTACQGLISLPYSRVISWLTVSHSFITSTHSLDHQLQVYWFRSDRLSYTSCYSFILGFSAYSRSSRTFRLFSESMYSVFMTSKCVFFKQHFKHILLLSCDIFWVKLRWKHWFYPLGFDWIVKYDI